MRFISGCGVICFSATIPKESSNDLEKKVIKCINLRTFNYWPSGLNALSTPIIDKTLEAPLLSDLRDSIRKLMKDQPVLVYSSQDTASDLAE